MEFENILRMLRKRKGYTQRQMAKKLKIKQPSYANYELGKYEPNIQMLIKIADILDVSLDELMGRTPPPKKQ